MAKKRDYHVTKPQGGEWQVKREGADRASSRHKTQTDATDRARDLAKKDRVDVVIHRPDGRIRDSDSYGKDPNPPHDRKH